MAAPGARMRTATPGACTATSRSNSRAGRPGSSRHHTRGLASVPQWIGIATRGASSAAACAARSGSRCPAPDVGAPAPHGQQRDVDVLGQPAHAVEDVGVAREVHARARPRPRTRPPPRSLVKRSRLPVVHGRPSRPRPRSRRARGRPGATPIVSCPVRRSTKRATGRAARTPGRRPAGRAATAGRGGRSARARRGSRRGAPGASGTAAEPADVQDPRRAAPGR